MAKSAAYSNDRRYVYKENQVRYLIYGRAFVGKPHDFGPEIQRNLRQPPEGRTCVKGGPHCPGHSGGGTNESIIFVFSEHYQTYPEYIVGYTL